MFDSALRLITIVISIGVFLYVLLSLSYSIGRDPNNDCYSSSNSDFAVQGPDGTNVTLSWRNLYFFNIAAQLFAAV